MGTIIVAFALGAVLTAIVINMRKNKGGSCAGCPNREGCPSYKNSANK